MAAGAPNMIGRGPGPKMFYPMSAAVLRSTQLTSWHFNEFLESYQFVCGSVSTCLLSG